MNFRASAEKIINTRNPGLFCALLLAPLTLASYLYGLIMTLRPVLYKTGIFKSHAAGCRVITVGNLTVGGTGKTPTVCLIASRLKTLGIRPVVLCRGYRGQKTDSALVVSDGKNIVTDAISAGDEAVMLAQKLPGIPIIAAKDRGRAAQTAIDRFDAQVIVLDDGFQYLRLKRDVNIVLINSQNPFGNGCLLPRGILREPLAALKRADIILLTKTGPHGRDTENLEKTISRQNPGVPVFRSFIRPVKITRVSDRKALPFNLLLNKKIACFCSIGDPGSFLKSLEETGISPMEKHIFPDHHRYGPADYTQLQNISKTADYLMTTEKDIAKFSPDMLQVKNLLVLEIEEVIDNTELFFKKLM